MTLCVGAGVINGANFKACENEGTNAVGVVFVDWAIGLGLCDAHFELWCEERKSKRPLRLAGKVTRTIT